MLSVDQIRNYPLFKDLSDSELEDLAACMLKRSYVKNSYLFRPGNPAMNIYLVESGMMRLFFCNSRGDEFLLNLMGPRSVIGHPMMMPNQIRLLGAAAQLPAVVLSLPYEDLYRLTRVSRQLCLNLYDEMVSVTQKLLRHYQSFITTGLEGRTAALFLSIGDGKIDEFDLPISQSDLAGWLGVSRGRLNRTLINFQKLGLIRQDGSRFFILDRQKLMQLSEGVIVNTL